MLRKMFPFKQQVPNSTESGNYYKLRKALQIVLRFEKESTI